MGPYSTITTERSRQGFLLRTEPLSFGRIKVSFVHKLLPILLAAIAWNAAAPLKAIARTQSSWAFHCSAQVRWGDAILPAGDYIFSVPPDDSRFVAVYQSSGQFVARITAQKVTREESSNPTFVFTANDGDGAYVTAVYVSDVASTLTFTKPGAKSQGEKPAGEEFQSDDAALGDTEPSPDRLFTIHSSTNETIPYLRAEALYLSACDVVEQEFHQPDPVRPRLTLSVGASANGVDFNKHEIQLKKWNGYQFAQGVVLLAMDDLLPVERRIALTKLAVARAESTVDLSELGGARTRGATPRD